MFSSGAWHGRLQSDDARLIAQPGGPNAKNLLLGKSSETRHFAQNVL